jgi:nucleoside-diphosphate-sugar epimerase
MDADEYRTDPSPVLVTGAGGFIGGWVMDRLLSVGVRVHVLIGPPGTPIPKAPKVDAAIAAGIGDLDALAALMAGTQAVIHLAGPPSVAASFDTPETYARDHVAGTATVLKAMHLTGVKRLVHVSSAEVYGVPRSNPVSEDHPTRPRSPYGAAKLGAEAFVHACAPTYGIGAAILRPFSVYGPGLPPRSLVGTVLGQVLAGSTVRVADSRPIRDYCFVGDVADAILSAFRLTAMDGVTTINVASGKGVSVADLAGLALEIAGREPPAIQAGIPDRPRGIDILELVANTECARHMLGWSARTSLRDGLARTIAWLQNREKSALPSAF